MMEEVRVRIPAGKILISEARCPHGCSLVNPDKLLSGKPALTAEVHRRGSTGLIHFNPYFGIYEYECDLPLAKGDIVEVHCPHCHIALSCDETCGLCNVPMFALQLPDGGEIRACPTVGCRNHNLTVVDLDHQFAAFYNEERRPKM